jgi:two-component system, sensor histidine kinase and response regulator
MDLNFNVHDKKSLILIVDDIPKNLQVLSSILNTENYKISFASNGAQAIDVAKSSMPDLILLDIMMPEMDGYEACRILKSENSTKHIPIIFLTGKAETDDVVRGLQLGAIDYVTKPFNSSELLTRVKTHLELKHSRDAIEEYNAELEKTQNELKSVIASKDKFFSIIAHDLRGPFSGFLGLSELLKDRYEDMSGEDVSRISSSMNQAAKNLFSFLENLLEWSRSQMGHMEYKPSKLDLSETVTRTFSIFEATAAEKKVELVNLIDKNTFATADNNMLNTIVRNLVSNALKFSNAEGKIELSTELADDNFVQVNVRDYGVGMNHEARSKMFKIEEKYSMPGTANEKGTGLGLILCKDLIEKHNGSISLESKTGEGTCFKFTLPID